MVVLVVLFLFRISLSSAFSRFIDSEATIQHVNVCKKLYSVNYGRTADIFEQTTVLSQITDMRKLCFLNCVYQLSGSVDASGVPRLHFVSSVIRKYYSPVDVEYWTEYNITTFAENLILMCSNADNTNLCFSSIKSIECVEAVLYLYHYGYMDSNITRGRVSSSTLSTAINEFQKFFSLNLTGTLDVDTLNAMHYPRCGLPDIENSSSRNKRYALYKNKWKKLDLTYRISRYPKKVSKRMINEEIARAFDAWISVSNLTIEKTDKIGADITLRFERRVHGDRAPFDGPGDVLAHTFYPLTTMNGHQNSFIHFDSAEKWTANTEAGVNLYQVAVHEIGHAFGLKHSKVQESVMWPKHNGYKANFTLHADDIKAIQALYGSNS